MAPIVGIAADRIGRRPVIVACLCMFGIFGTAVALAPTLPLLIVARFLQGVGSAGLLNLAVVLIGDVTSGDRRTKLIGRNSAAPTPRAALTPPGKRPKMHAGWAIPAWSCGSRTMAKRFCWRPGPKHVSMATPASWRFTRRA